MSTGFLRGSSLAQGALLGALVWALTRTYPNYDSYYHLVWGRELLDGLAPSFEAYAAPTQHPLYVALGAARRIGPTESQNPSSHTRTTPVRLAVGPSLVEGFVKAFTFTSTRM